MRLKGISNKGFKRLAQIQNDSYPVGTTAVATIGEDYNLEPEYEYLRGAEFKVEVTDIDGWGDTALYITKVLEGPEEVVQDPEVWVFGAEDFSSVEIPEPEVLS